MKHVDYWQVTDLRACLECIGNYLHFDYKLQKLFICDIPILILCKVVACLIKKVAWNEAALIGN